MVIINLTKHSYLLTRIISDKGSAFVFQENKKVADVPGINLEHSTTKHAQTREDTHFIERSA